METAEIEKAITEMNARVQVWRARVEDGFKSRWQLEMGFDEAIREAIEAARVAAGPSPLQDLHDLLDDVTDLYVEMGESARFGSQSQQRLPPETEHEELVLGQSWFPSGVRASVRLVMKVAAMGCDLPHRG